MDRRKTRICEGLVCVALSALAGGCPPAASSPPPEAVLAGTWKVEYAEATPLTDLFFTFDQDGALVGVTYQIGGTSITNNNPRGSTHVDGANVTIDSTFAGNGRVFTGTFGDTPGLINGHSVLQFEFGSITSTTDEGQVTLTKQP